MAKAPDVDARNLARELKKAMDYTASTVEYTEKQQESLASMTQSLGKMSQLYSEIKSTNTMLGKTLMSNSRVLSGESETLSKNMKNMIDSLKLGKISVRDVTDQMRYQIKELLERKKLEENSYKQMKDQVTSLKKQIRMYGDADGKIQEMVVALELQKKSSSASVKVWQQLIDEAELFLYNVEGTGAELIAAYKTMKLMKDIDLGEMFERMSNNASRLPIFGNKIAEKIKGLRRGVESSIQTAFTNAEKSGGGLMNVMKSLGKESGAIFGGTLKAGGWMILAQLVMDLIQKFQDINKAVIEMNKSTGMLNEQWKQFRSIVIDTHRALAQYGVTAEVAAQSVTSLFNTFGNTQRISEKLVQTTSLMVTNLGLTADEATDYMNTMMNVGNLTEQQATNLAGATVQLAKLGKTTAKRVMQDIAKSSEYINKYMRGSVIEATKAAVQMQRMGISLEKAGKMADTLLNWDENISAEMEASVMLGRQFNLEQARALMWEGKLGQAAEAVTDQIGTLNDWNQMNILQKQAITKATGLEASEIAKTLKQKAAIGKMDDAELKKYEKAKQQLEDINDISKERLLKEQSIQVETQKMSQAWDKLVAAFTPLLTLIFNILSPIADLLYALVAPLDAIYSAFKDSTSAAEALFRTVKAIVMPLTTIIGYGWLWGTQSYQENISSGVLDETTSASMAGMSIPFAEGGIVTNPTNALIGEAGPEAVIPLKDFGMNEIIKELVKLNSVGSSIIEFMISAKTELISSINELSKSFVPSGKTENTEFITKINDMISSVSSRFLSGIELLINKITSISFTMPSIIIDNKELVSKMDAIISAISSISIVPSITIDNKELVSKMDAIISAISSISIAPNITIDNKELVSKMDSIISAILSVSIMPNITVTPSIMIDNKELVSKMDAIISAISSISIAPNITIDNKELVSKMDSIISTISSILIAPNITIDNKELISKINEIISAISSISIIPNITIDNKELVSKMDSIISTISSISIVPNITIDNNGLISKINEIISILSAGMNINYDTLVSKMSDSIKSSISNIVITPNIIIDNKELISKINEMISGMSYTPSISVVTDTTELSSIMTQLNNSIINIFESILNDNNQMSSKMNDLMMEMPTSISTNNTELLSNINEMISNIFDKQINETKSQPITETKNTYPDNENIIAKLDELVTTMKTGFAVYMDGQKVGDAIAKGIPHPVLSQHAS